MGLLPEKCYRQVQEKQQQIFRLSEDLHLIKITPKAEVNEELLAKGETILKTAVSMATLLKRPGCNMKIIQNYDFMKDHAELWGNHPLHIQEQVENNIKYEGYISRQQQELKHLAELERVSLSSEIKYAEIPGLSGEVIEKLNYFRPTNLGQASRISGITPAAMTVIRIFLKNKPVFQKQAS